MKTNSTTIRRIMIFLLLAVLANPGFSQLSGAYTIGGASPDYASISDAVSDLNSSGISGNVTFSIRSGMYAGDHSISSFTGNNSFSTTFQSETENAADVVVTSFSFSFQINSANNISLKNLTLAGGNSGVEVYSTDNCRIIGNTIKDFATYGILSTFESNSLIEGNVITSQTGYNPFGIYEYGASGSCKISKNRIAISGVDAPSGIIVDVSANNSGGTTSVENNFVATSGISNAYGIQIFSYDNFGGPGQGQNVIHNSVNVYGSSENEATAFFMFVDNGNNLINIVDNIFANNNATQFGQTNNCASRINVYSNSGGTINADYNNYFLATGGNLFMDNGTPGTTLAAHQTLTGRDANSKNVNPGFTTSSNLHVSNSALASGTPWPGITNDIDAESRSATSPWMGADEGQLNFPCGPNGTKVSICHRPPGNPNNFQTICIAPQAVSAHLAHGCTLGPCPNNKTGEYSEENAVLNVYPNPFQENFTIEFGNLHGGSSLVELYDALGRVVNCIELMETEGVNQVELTGSGLTPGIYLVKYSCSGTEVTKKIVKE
jgi:Secretion system C-terminal sorting domain